MKPIREWTQRSRTLLTLTLCAIGVLILVAILTTDTGPTEAETARYQRLRVECTAAADQLGLVRRARIEAINDCLLANY